MKRFFILTAMLMLAFSTYAQQLEGLWSGSDKFSKKINKDIDDPDVKATVGLLFGKADVYMILFLTAESDGMKMDIAFTVPGTYTRDGNHVTCVFKKEETEFSLRDIESDDPSLKTMLSSEETKAVTLQMFEGQIKGAMKEMLPEMAELSNIFKDFTINSITETKMLLQLDKKTEAEFDKLQ